MNIKTRLSVQFTLIIAGVLLFFSALVYYFSFSSQLGKHRRNLLEKAENTAILYTNIAEVDSTLLKKIHQSTISLEKEEICLTDNEFNILYSNNLEFLDSVVMRRYAEPSVNYFAIGEKDGVCLSHFFDGKGYYVYVMAHDRPKKENLRELQKILLYSSSFSVLLSVLFAYFFSQRAIKPIRNIVKSVKEINSLQLNRRLDEGNRKDEIAQLAITFNGMISNLEEAFRNQEDFVSNASHELRTPLTVMMGESDYFLSHDHSNEEFREHIRNLVADMRKINSLLNSLLELAQINRDTMLPFSPVRIDEVVFNSIKLIAGKYPGRKIVPRINYPENSDDLLVSGHAGMLEIAFKNLIDNACKFSSDEVFIDFSFDLHTIIICITDKGISIPSGEERAIFNPFSRASNARYIGGYGIGLSLVRKIITLHNSKMELTRPGESGTSFIVSFPKLN